MSFKYFNIRSIGKEAADFNAVVKYILFEPEQSIEERHKNDTVCGIAARHCPAVRKQRSHR